MDGNSTSRSIIFVLIAVLWFSIISVLVKTLGTGVVGPSLHPVIIVAGRFCFAFLFIAATYIAKPIPLKGAPIGLHLRRSLAGWLGIGCLFGASVYIPLADANAISFFSVAVTLFFSSILLKESVGSWRWSAACVAFLGTLLIVRPGSEAFHPASIVAFLSAIFIGIEAIFLKQLSNKESSRRILFLNNLIGASISIVAVSFIWQTPTTIQWIILIAIGGFMSLAQYFNILALKSGEASFIVPFWYAAPVFIAVFDYVVFGQILGVVSITGILMIIGAGLVISYREAVRRKTK